MLSQHSGLVVGLVVCRGPGQAAWGGLVRPYKGAYRPTNRPSPLQTRPLTGPTSDKTMTTGRFFCAATGAVWGKRG